MLMHVYPAQEELIKQSNALTKIVALMSAVTKNDAKWSLLLGTSLIIMQGISRLMGEWVFPVAVKEEVIYAIAASLVWIGYGVYAAKGLWAFKKECVVTLGAVSVSHLYNIFVANYFRLDLDKGEGFTLAIVLGISIVLWAMYALFWIKVGQLIYQLLLLFRSPSKLPNSSDEDA